MISHIRAMSRLFTFGMLSFAPVTSVMANSEPGLISSAQTGMPDQLWIDESAERMSRLMGNTKNVRWPVINRQFMIVSLSQSKPELSEMPHEEMGAARLNYLSNVGAIDAAEVLARLYSWESDAIRKEVETISLLSTRPERYCQGLIEGEYTEIENGMLVYCFARFDRYDEAVARLEETRDEMSAERHALLARFLDINEDDPLRDRPWIELPPPFEFVLDEGIGRPRGLKHLPPAYDYFSRESGITPRADLEITEELVHLGALPPPVLFAAYRSNNEDLRGGAWARADAIKALDNLKFDSDENQIENALNDAWQSFSENQMEQLFAVEAESILGFYDPLQFENASLKELFVRTAILGNWSQSNWMELVPRNDPQLMLTYLLRHPDVNVAPNQIFTKSALARIVKDAFFSDQINPLEANAFGEAIWQSLFIIDTYRAYTDEQVKGAFQSLRISGLDNEARSIAITLLMGERGS